MQDKEKQQAHFGLKPDFIDAMNGVFAAFPEVAQVILYGSRAKGNFRNGSDIDLCMSGQALTTPILLRVDNALDDLLMPYKIDLSLIEHIKNAELLEHIKRIGIVFYERKAAEKTA